ncbi:MAG: hypothetical protein LBS50_11865 [Prevotellaceae bacterium]|jgi:hypothetical protein|nr:hypothetical protein [Prevotellaceae bacterium]
MKKQLLLILIIAASFMSASVFGQITSVQNGDWASTLTWGGTLPTANDDVIINHNVRINATGLACANLTVNAGKTLNFNSNTATNIFTVNGDFIINGTFVQNNNQGFPVEVYGDFIVNGEYQTSGQNAAGQTIIMKGDGETVIGGTALAVNTNNHRMGNLTIDLNSNDAVVTLESDIYFLEGNDNSNSKKLTINKGVLDCAGHGIHFRKTGQIIVNANGNFAWSHVNCDFTDDNLPSIYWHEQNSGSEIKVTGTIYIKDFILENTDANYIFPNNAAATVYVFGTLNSLAGGQTNMGAGTFIWGPDSWYKASGTQGTPPSGVYAATGGTTKTPNEDYEIPDAIQNVLDDCSNTTPCTAVNQNLTVQAENAVVCTGESTNIQVLNSENEVLYSLFVGQNQIGSDVVGTGATINLPTGIIAANTTFAVKTSVANDVFCKNKKIGGNIVVTLASGTAPIATSNIQFSGIMAGENYSISLSNYTGAIQWQTSANGTDDWTDIEGATSATYSTNTLAGNVTGILYYFRAKVTGGTCGDTFSNSVHITIFTPAPMPNLVVTDLSWTPANVGIGTQVVFTAKIKNIGDVDIPAGRKIGVKFSVNNTYVNHCDTYYDGLSAGAEALLTSNGGPNAVPHWTPANMQTYTVDAFVDDDNQTVEGNENDNHLTKQIEVSTNVPTCDLVIEAVTWTFSPSTTECPQAGDDIVFTAKVKNIGTAASPANIVCGVSFYTNSTVSEVSYNRTYNSSIPVGETVDITALQTWRCPTGTLQTVYACVDDFLFISELFENNNCIDPVNIQTNGACASSLDEVSISDKVFVENGKIVTADNSAEILAIYNILGKEVRNENLQQGVYIVKIKQFGKINSGKILVQ